MGGRSRFVDCADERNTRGECSNLQVCVIKGSLHVQMVGLPKPYIVELELADMLPGLLNGRCNVAVGHTTDLEKALLLVPNHFAVKLGKRVLSSEPLAIATRDDDPQWSDLVNWVLLALMVSTVSKPCMARVDLRLIHSLYYLAIVFFFIVVCGPTRYETEFGRLFSNYYFLWTKV